MPDLTVALVGCGGIADAYAEALRGVDGARLVAAVDPDPRAASRLAERTGAAPFADLGAVPACDAALVLTPPDTHEELSCALLARGVHVLCEKPLAPSVEAADRMLAAAAAAGRRLMMGSKFRFTPDVQAARRLLDQGVCGDVVLYENVFCSHVDMTQRWNSQPRVSGGGVLIDNGCHSVDLARYLLGPLASVQAQFGRRVQALPVEDTARMLFRSRGDALGSIDLSWSVHKQTDAYVRLIGSAGTLEIGWRGSRWKASRGDWTDFGEGYQKIPAFRAQLQNFFACCREEAAPIIDDTDARASVVVIDCAYRAAHEARWVAIPAPSTAGTP
ncbi:MAG: Gfo/Idh/MocA family protein [Planctomycetota bacterium]